MYPILLEVPGLQWPIYSYGVMLGLSIIAGWYLSLYLSQRDGLPRRAMGSCFFWTIAAALAGARLLYLVTNPDEVNSLGDVFKFREGGLVAYGGFLGGFLGSYIYCRVKGFNIWAWADETAPCLAVGLGITRIGCFLYGCCYGRRLTDADPAWLHSTAVPFPNWSERFPDMGEAGLRGAPAFTHHVADFGLAASAAESFPIVPTQLMASANGMIALALLLILRRYRTFRGVIFLGFGVYYGLTRFLFEIVRDDTQRGTVGPSFLGWFGGFEGRMTTSQLIGLVTVAASTAGLAWLWRRSKRDPEAAMALGPGAKTEKKEEPRGGRQKSRRGGKKRKKK